MNSLSVTIKMKAIEQSVPESADEILKCDHSKESY